jgi:hypothetical protein
MKNSARLATFAVLVALSTSTLAQEEWRNWPTGDKWVFAAGYFAPDLDTSIVVTDEDGNIGTGISFEKNLGLDDSEGTFMATIGWRFAKRHKLSYSYFQLDRSATTTDSTVTIAVGDEVFDLTLPIQSFFDITANELSYSYSVIFTERTDLSVGIGLSLQDLALGLQGTASSPDPGAVINEQADSTAPLPTLNLGFNYAFNDKWVFQSKLGWLAVELEADGGDSLDGQIINANIGIWWKAFKNVGFFANYQLFDVDVDYTERNAVFAVNYDYKGPLLGVAVNF